MTTRTARIVALALLLACACGAASAGAAVPAPVLGTPANGAVLGPWERPAFRWTLADPSKVTRAKVEISRAGFVVDDSAGAGGAFEDDWQSYRRRFALHAGLYRWRVTAIQAGGSAVSAERRFKVRLDAGFSKVQVLQAGNAPSLHVRMFSNAPLTEVSYLLTANGRQLFKRTDSVRGTNERRLFGRMGMAACPPCEANHRKGRRTHVVLKVTMRANGVTRTARGERWLT